MRFITQTILAGSLFLSHSAFARTYSPFLSQSLVATQNYVSAPTGIGFLLGHDADFSSATGFQFSTSEVRMNSNAMSSWNHPLDNGNIRVQNKSVALNSLHVFHRFDVAENFKVFGLSVGLSVDSYDIANNFEGPQMGGNITSQFLAVSPHIGLNTLWTFASEKGILSLDFLEISKPATYATHAYKSGGYGISGPGEPAAIIGNIANRLSSKLTNWQLTAARIGLGIIF